MGIDGIALCASEEDFTVSNDLNLNLLTNQQEPWYNCIKEKQLENLFSEHEHSGIQKQKDFEIYKNFTYIFQEDKAIKKKRKRFNSDNSQDHHHKQ